MSQHIDKTKAWIEKFVIKFNLCPFASHVFNSNKILFIVESNNTLELQLITFWDTITSLNSSDQYSTAFTIYPSGMEDFESFLDFCDRADWLLSESPLSEHFQLANFHPDYVFADSESNDPSDYTNRSPLPMIHILKKIDVRHAIENYIHTEDIPEINKAKLRQMGLEQIKFLLKDIC